MTEGLPPVLLVAPMVIAVAAIAVMIGVTGSRAPRRLTTELGYRVEPGSATGMTLARYVGGHPDLDVPVGKPYVLLTHKHLAVFARHWGMKLFAMPWPQVEQVTMLSRDQMEAAAIAVRGLAPGAFESAAPESQFLRVRYMDERGWWQNVIFELSATAAAQQLAEVQAFWQKFRQQPDGETPATVTP
jgi:hypothetical protein